MKFRHFRIPDLSDSLHIFGKAKSELLPPQFELFVWNIYKGQRRGWLEEFKKMTSGHDLMLIQEALLKAPGNLSGLQDIEQKQWKLASSFEYKKNQFRTGVVTGSSANALNTQALRGPERELWFLTPKMILTSSYSIEGRQEELLVVNTHAINFASQLVFERFIHLMGNVIKDHQGPVLAAGDFNTWSQKRWNFLRSFMLSLGLEEVAFPKDHRSLRLDHIFFRGFEILDAEILDKVRTSDHFPLRAKLKF
jgi:endonuclease/exonuclease/phosphatase (EEP) superfamily protein YafD